MLHCFTDPKLNMFKSAQGDSIHAQSAPRRAEIRDESSKSRKASKAHCMCGPSCTGAADDPFELREHPGMAHGARPIQNPWRRRKRLLRTV